MDQELISICLSLLLVLSELINKLTKGKHASIISFVVDLIKRLKPQPKA